MAADESQVPATPWPGKGWCQELYDNVIKAVAMGIADGMDDSLTEFTDSLLAEISKR